MKFKRVAFIVNPVAGGGRGQARWDAWRAALASAASVVKARFTSQPGDAVRIADEVGRESDLVVAVGGDGTLLEVASGLLSAGVPPTLLGVVPAGTGNDTARQLGVSSLEQARLALRGARTRIVDAIRIRFRAHGASVSRHALLFGAVGIAQEALRRTTPLVKRLFGRRLAYPVGALRALRTYRAPPMRVCCDGQTAAGRFLLVCVSNAEQAGGGLRLAPGAQLDDGLLHVNMCESVSRGQALMLLWRLFRGRHLSHPKVRYVSARQVAVQTEPPVEVEADGEILGHTPAQFAVVPRALRVLVP